MEVYLTHGVKKEKATKQKKGIAGVGGAGRDEKLRCRPSRQGKATQRANMTCLHDLQLTASGLSSRGFPCASPALETFGLKFSSGGAHISRTMMLAELGAVLDNVPKGSDAAEYRDAILHRNLLGKSTDSTRQKSLRHLRELYALDEGMPIFGLLRKLHGMDGTSLPLLAVQVAWARDPLL